MRNEDFIFSDSSQCDLTNREAVFEYVNDLVSTSKISGVIHLAARSGGAQLSKSEPAGLFRDNLLMAINLLEACREHNLNRVLLTLSTTCYSTNLSDPTENLLHSGPLNGVDYAYGYSKRMLEPLMKSYNSQFGMEISAVLVNGIVGPNMNYNDGESILPAALIKRFSEFRFGKEAIEVWGDGTPVREYTYSGDLAKAMLWCFENQPKDSLLNIGSNEKISVRQCAETICEVLGINKDRIKYLIDKPNGRLLQSTNNKKFRIMSDFQFTSFREAIKIAIEWYEKSAPISINLRK